MMKDNLYLIGYRCTGKSAVSHILAKALQWTAVDADVLLEQHFRKTIKQIFAEEGEAGFRDKESLILQTISKTNNQVVATGGGVILRPENRSRLKDTGQVVWLQASPQTLWERMQKDSTTEERRPNLSKGGLQEIEELLQFREPLYAECADLIVDSGKLSPEEVADTILQSLRKLGKQDPSVID